MRHGAHKQCSKCRESKPVCDFNRCSAKPDGLHHYCRKCQNRVTRDNAIKRLYGLEPEQFHRMVEEQHGLCYICRKPSAYRGLHIDHCHATGNIRRLLCNDCNLGLGKFKDNPELLEKAAAYLREFR